MNKYIGEISFYILSIIRRGQILINLHFKDSYILIISKGDRFTLFKISIGMNLVSAKTKKHLTMMPVSFFKNLRSLDQLTVELKLRLRELK